MAEYIKYQLWDKEYDTYCGYEFYDTYEEAYQESLFWGGTLNRNLEIRECKYSGNRINQALIFCKGSDRAYFNYAQIYYDRATCNLICVPDEHYKEFVDTQLTADMKLVFGTLEHCNKFTLKY